MRVKGTFIFSSGYNGYLISSKNCGRVIVAVIPYKSHSGRRSYLGRGGSESESGTFLIISQSDCVVVVSLLTLLCGDCYGFILWRRRKRTADNWIAKVIISGKGVQCARPPGRRTPERQSGHCFGRKYFDHVLCWLLHGEFNSDPHLCCVCAVHCIT